MVSQLNPFSAFSAFNSLGPLNRIEHDSGPAPRMAADGSDVASSIASTSIPPTVIGPDAIDGMTATGVAREIDAAVGARAEGAVDATGAVGAFDAIGSVVAGAVPEHSAASIAPEGPEGSQGSAEHTASGTLPISASTAGAAIGRTIDSFDARDSFAKDTSTSVPPFQFPVAPQDVGPWTGATRRVLHSPEVRESFYRFGMVAPDAKLYWDVMGDFVHDATQKGYWSSMRGQGVKRTWKFFTTPTAKLLPWIESLLEGNREGQARFVADKATFTKSLEKGRMLGAGFGALLAVSSWNKLCRTMDDPHSTAFEKSIRWVDLATSLLACIPELPQMRLLSFTLAIVTAVFEAAFWSKRAAENKESEPNGGSATKMLRALSDRAKATLGVSASAGSPSAGSPSAGSPVRD